MRHQGIQRAEIQVSSQRIIEATWKRTSNSSPLLFFRSDALRTAFHRIDDILEDQKYANLLNRLKALPNPSDNKSADDSDNEFDDNMEMREPPKLKYTKFDPTDPQWESDDEDSSNDRAGVEEEGIPLT